MAKKNGLKSKDAKAIITSYLELAAGEIKKKGQFKIAGMLNLKLKKKPATPARKGVNPFTKEPCVFNAKPASKTVRALAMNKLKGMVNGAKFLSFMFEAFGGQSHQASSCVGPMQLPLQSMRKMHSSMVFICHC